MTLSKLNPLKGSLYIPLLEKILKKKAVVNLKNENDDCFKLHVTLGMNEDLMFGKNSDRISKELLKRMEELNWDGIESPTPCSARVFEKFGKNNDVSILVFGLDVSKTKDGKENAYVIPLHVPVKRRSKIVRLLFQKNEDGTKNHYSLIKSMSRLVASQISGKKAKKYICDYCLIAFGKEDLLIDHEKYCLEHDAVKVVMPKWNVNNILEFKNIQNRIECPLKIYADFECFTKPIDEKRGKTKLYQKHDPSAVCIYVVSRVDGFSMDPVVIAAENETTK